VVEVEVLVEERVLLLLVETAVALHLGQILALGVVVALHLGLVLEVLEEVLL
jgi:hypothetical protein